VGNLWTFIDIPPLGAIRRRTVLCESTWGTTATGIWITADDSVAETNCIPSSNSTSRCKIDRVITSFLDAWYVVLLAFDAQSDWPVYAG